MARKTYSEEFRRQAVELYRSTPGASLRGIATDLGITRGTLATWVAALDPDPTTGTTGAARARCQRWDRPATAGLAAGRARRVACPGRGVGDREQPAGHQACRTPRSRWGPTPLTAKPIPSVAVARPAAASMRTRARRRSGPRQDRRRDRQVGSPAPPPARHRGSVSMSISPASDSSAMLPPGPGSVSRWWCHNAAVTGSGVMQGREMRPGKLKRLRDRVVVCCERRGACWIYGGPCRGRSHSMSMRGHRGLRPRRRGAAGWGHVVVVGCRPRSPAARSPPGLTALAGLERGVVVSARHAPARLERHSSAGAVLPPEEFKY
jgi:transposase